MNKFIYFNENIKCTKGNMRAFEGGLVRNIAFMRWIRENINNLQEIIIPNNRFHSIIIVLSKMITSKISTIYFQYTTVGVPLYNPTIFGKILSQIFLWSVTIAARNNEVIFDISDLKYEQCIDLQISLERKEIYKKFEKKLFQLNSKFIFASESMRKYACEKYRINVDNTETCINGGNPLLSDIVINDDILKLINNDNKIVYVYAGTLNRGRQIENIIEQFPDICNIELILMGTDGEWLNETILQRNIKYIGAFEDEIAHKIASQCDVGLIAYDSKRFYYNIAYPTKLSFYITAEIPVLSTPVDEVKEVFNIYDIGFLKPIEEWSSFISSLTKLTIEKKKNSISSFSSKFYWKNLISSIRLLE